MNYVTWKFKEDNMKNILILSNGTSHDLITASHLVGSLKKENPSTNIELVTTEEFRELSDVVNNVSRFHYLDASIVTNIIDNPLYSDAFAINKFMEVIAPLGQTKWDQIINYSNDNISAFLINAIGETTKIGTYINNSGAPRCTGKWNIFQNYVASGLTRQTIDKVTVRNHMAQVPLHTDIEKIKTNEDYSVVASQNFSRIRQMKGSPATFIVGINLESGYDGYGMELDTYIDIIETLEESSDYKPVLLLNGKNYQRQIANDLNKHFDNNLISINIESVALPSVLSNLDTIVSSSNDQLAIADTMESKCIELRDFSGKTYTPLTTSPENYIIYVKEEKTIASDILLALNEEFGTELPIDFMTSTNPVYKTVQDNYGNFQTQIRGDLNIQQELRYHIERSFFYNTLGYEKNTELIDHIKTNTEKEVLSEYIVNLKSELTCTVKILLATLRSLKGVKNSETNLNSFITYLDNLIAVGKENTIVSSVIRNFEGRVENIDTNDIDSNIKAIETNLFQLKGELQTLTNYMSDLASDTVEPTVQSVELNKEA
jgi:ADP-heptose:LPS heptosyltransferase